VLQRLNDRIRLTVQLLRTADGVALWSGKFDKRVSDIFALQDSVSEQVAQELLVQLNAQNKEKLARHYQRDPDAYQAYLKGRYFWNKRSREGYEKAIEHFNQAILLDPNYAQAYVGLADAYQFKAGFGDISRTEAFARSRALLQKALELDETLAEAHASLGLIAMNYDWDWPTAEREYKRAIQLNPNHALTHDWYGEYLNAFGRSDEALAEMRRAREIDPLSLVINMDTGKLLAVARRYDEAIEQLQRHWR
jgi:Tfp pilus assembly protein PilF